MLLRALLPVPVRRLSVDRAMRVGRETRPADGGCGPCGCCPVRAPSAGRYLRLLNAG